MPKTLKEKLADIEAAEKAKTEKAAEEAAAKRTALKDEAEKEYKEAVATLKEAIKPLQAAVDEAAESYWAVTKKYPSGYSPSGSTRAAPKATGSGRKTAPPREVLLTFVRENPNTNTTAIATGLSEYSESGIERLVKKLKDEKVLVNNGAERGTGVALNVAK